MAASEGRGARGLRGTVIRVGEAAWAAYMMALAYVAAFVVFRVASALGG